MFLLVKTAIRIDFDPRSCTEDSYDTLTFHKDSSGELLCQISGESSNFSSVIEYSDRIWMKFKTDESRAEWGWSLIARALPPRQIKCCSGIESHPNSHFSTLSLDEYQIIDLNDV